ncbi:MAG: carbamoyltransferase [Omnitrophica bacterium]|nr:carbamoyltransferase [Candidatus Omnitrophota bacterium]
MKILGIAAPFGHDSSAALLIDGKVVAAAEEERFTRKKHAEGQLPINSVNFCLKQTGLNPAEIDCIAYPWSVKILKQKKVEYFLRTICKRPARARKRLFRTKKDFNDQKNLIYQVFNLCGFNASKARINWIEHHIAHAASSFCFSGMDEAAILSLDVGGEITSSLMGNVLNKKINKFREIICPDSLGAFYSTMTDYLGFKRGNGEYKVMGMAPYGDSSKLNFDHIIWWNDKKKIYRCSDNYVWVQRGERFRMDKIYSKKMVLGFGPQREGDGLAEPYIHIAAVTQKKLEDITLRLVEAYLKKELKRHGNLCFAGGIALNVSLNKTLLALPYVKNLWVQPAAHDSGSSLGAAAYVAFQAGEDIEPMRHVYLGPEFSNQEIEEELKKFNFPFSLENDICEVAADLLNKGKIVGWFQGRMEWGPRALGNRSILGNSTIKGTADKINALIKFREKWRPFCPSILKEHAQDILGSTHPAPFMTIAFKVNPEWRQRIPEVVHVNGTCRPQVVEKETNPKFYKVIENFYKKTGVPVVINTSLNRRGEPIVCTPKDALVMFEGSGLEYLAMGDFLVKKKVS